MLGVMVRVTCTNFLCYNFTYFLYGKIDLTWTQLQWTATWSTVELLLRSENGTNYTQRCGVINGNVSL